MSTSNIEDIYRLSPMQQGMFFHSLLAPDSGMYFEQSSYKLEGQLSVSAFQEAWQYGLDRHAALRSAFMWEDLDEPLQVVYRSLVLPFEFMDWRKVERDQIDQHLSRFLIEDRERGFDMSRAPLMRLTLIQVDDQEYYFIWSHHHLLLDGWSQPIIIKDVFTYYEASLQGIQIPVEPARSYREYIGWLQKQDMNEAKTYWQNVLKGFITPTSLPEQYLIDTTDENQAPEMITENEDYAIRKVVFDEKLSRDLNSFAKQAQLTLNTIIQSAWGILLSRYSGENDVLFGATVSGRPVDLPGADTIVGLFINTLPVRVLIEKDEPVIKWMKQFQTQQAQSRQYEYAPLFDIQSWCDVPKDMPLFESLLVFENYPIEDVVQEEKGSLKIEQNQAFTRTNYPLTVAFSPGKRVGLEIAYDCSRFSHGAVKRMQKHLITLLQSILSDPNQLVCDINILTSLEQEKIIKDWNNTLTDNSGLVCVHQLFEKQVEKTPMALAVDSKQEKLTYQDLNQRANQLAYYLIDKGLVPNTMVGIAIERSAQMIVAIIGVLKAGGVYVPLDPNYPSERIAFMMDDAGVPFLITQEKLLHTLPENNAQVICIDKDWGSIGTNSRLNPIPSAGLNDLAYVIYTSGSTGQPKGVPISHRSLANHALALSDIMEINTSDRMLQFISLSFDASGEEIYPTLVRGATLVVPDGETNILGADLLKYCAQQEVTILHLAVPVWHQVVDGLVAEDLQIPETLRLLFLGGESIATDKLSVWCKEAKERDTVSPMILINGYGPTETTISATVYKKECVLKELAKYQKIPIGRPIANVQVYILDKNLKPVPVGAPGELYIGGIGLSRGYLHHPELSAESFIPDPFNKNGEKLYRTGDLARYLPDGNIEFLGRVDFQVKLRGFRVELGEIEAALRTYSGIDDAIAMVHEDTTGDKRLVAYVLFHGSEGESEREVDLTRIREYLKERLPGYMVPSLFVQIDEIPLTPSGKVDRKRLPKPEDVRMDATSGYEAPRTPVEEIIVGLWSEVLGIEHIGVFDNFFDLGGHSLKATQLLSKLRQTFEIELPLREIFENPTVAGNAEAVTSALESREGEETAPEIEIIPRDEETGLPTEPPPLSFSQQRLWFLEQLDPGNLAWNIPLFVRIEGNLNIAALEASLGALIRRHESLRTTFDAVNGHPVQIIHAEGDVQLKVLDIRSTIKGELTPEKFDNEVKKIGRQEVQQPFDLVDGPLMRGAVIRVDDDDNILILTLHHIIADGWSLSILVRELATLYHAYTSKDESFEFENSDGGVEMALVEDILPALPIQYADFSVWQRNWLQGETLEKQLNYWKEKLANIPPVLELPTDHPRPALKTANGSSKNFLLPTDLSGKIIRLSRQEGVTPYMFLLAAFQTLLFRYSGQEDICIGTAIANRTRPQIEGLIGFFVNSLVMRVDLSGSPSFRNLLKQVRETALGAYAHQDLPFEMLVEEIQPERNLSYTPIFQVGFDYQETPIEALELPDLKFNAIQMDSGTTPYDLLLSITHTQSEDGTEQYLSGSMEYNTDLYEKDTIERMLAHYEALLNAIVDNLDCSVATVSILTEAEKQQILIDWNATTADFPSESCIHQRFEYQVDKQPQAIAIIYETQEITYQELNKRANQLAHYLRKMDVGRDKLVGISTLRSPEMIVAILGILKAGGAYLPIDPTYPRERLEFMIEDSQISILLTQSDLVEILPGGLEMLCLDTDWKTISEESDENLGQTANPEDLAYVIYTSGSTGRPKGTLLRHRGLCNLAEFQRLAFKIDANKRVLQFSPFSFDASVWETFMALANGGALCLAKQETLASGFELINLMKEKNITTVTLPPSLLSVLPADQISSAGLPDLVTVIAAGEACTQEIVANWAPGREFFNAYGPTETTVCASMKLVDEKEPNDPPIGRPIANTKLYILDKNLQPVPVGVPGELMVGGVSLARGYLNRPEMTAEKFIPNPFQYHGGWEEPFYSEEMHHRLYRTGDLVRYRKNGDIEFLGRVDFQVKVRGHRIEVGEIEAALRAYSNKEHIPILEAVVIVREDVPGDKRLVAYLLVDDSEKFVDLEKATTSELRQYLRETLPEYMIPSAFVYLNAFPISPAGKIDRIALQKYPAPEIERQELGVEFVAPRNDIETKLALISAELLGINQVEDQPAIGVFDNFFELGGHSLLATQFISRIREEFRVELPLRTLFEHPTIAEMAMEIEILNQQGPQAQPTTIKRVSREDRRVRRSTLEENDYQE